MNNKNDKIELGFKTDIADKWSVDSDFFPRLYKKREQERKEREALEEIKEREKRKKKREAKERGIASSEVADNDSQFEVETATSTVAS